MKPKLLVLFSFFVLSTILLLAWGPEGHDIVGKLALPFVTAEVRANELNLLKSMPMDTAANWMGIMKSNADYEFMRPWDYIDFEKGKAYSPGIDDNLVNRLTLTYNELRHKNVLCEP